MSTSHKSYMLSMPYAERQVLPPAAHPLGDAVVARPLRGGAPLALHGALGRRPLAALAVAAVASRVVAHLGLLRKATVLVQLLRELLALLIS